MSQWEPEGWNFDDSGVKLHVYGDIRTGISSSHGLILTSPNGTKYRLSVDDAGNLSTNPV